MSNLETLQGKRDRMYQRHLSYKKENDIENAEAFLAAVEKFDLEINKIIASEKKNDLANSIVEPSAVATSADAQQQLSTTSPKSEGTNLDVGVHFSGDSSNDILGKKWVGKAHKDSFLTAKAFERFMKVKHKLKTLIVNFLKLEDTEINDASKKNTMIDLSRELARIVNNDVKKEYKKDLLERKFFVRKGKNKVFYGCDEKLINNIFKTN